MTAPPPSPPSPGPYRLTGALRQTPAGYVFGAVDGMGRAVQVVLLSKGAAGDAAARDRFAAAVRGEKGRLLSYDVANPGPWAVGEGDLSGLLDSVALRERGGGPPLAHHWVGAEEPAYPVTESGATPRGSGGPYLVFPRYTASGAKGGAGGAGGGTPRRDTLLFGGTPGPGGNTGPWGTILAAVAVIIMLLLILGAVIWLWRSQPEELPPEPVETITTPTPSPGQTGSPRPTPSPTGTNSPTPGEDGSPGQGDPTDDNPL
ncbi:hypothetical protein EDD29_6055 [Actinocorallia herbida]|uniref:Uncharacterized protein n=1 Tax=Actinocorallia herbida TaxID=58109 RepID=A0A3N1D4I6_9ACTN|nr:hypothetical protein [Actinocorallia herbida]ROO88386.1 hypothetical protein EDD29_6055 [Actinocorallia herbida]